MGVAVVVTVGVAVLLGSNGGLGVFVGGIVVGGIEVGGLAVGGFVVGVLGAQSGSPGRPQFVGQAGSAGSQLCALTLCELPANPMAAIITIRKK